MGIAERVLDCAVLGGRRSAIDSRDLDALVAENLLGWRLVEIGKDAFGEGECSVLAPNGILGVEFENGLPPKGAIGKAFFVPQYSRSLAAAMGLAKKFGYGKVLLPVCANDEVAAEMIVLSILSVNGFCMGVV